eukprot:942850-Pleurochrysis_carterae.AAC.2
MNFNNYFATDQANGLVFELKASKERQFFVEPAESVVAASQVENLEAETSDADGKVESGGHLV